MSQCLEGGLVKLVNCFGAFSLRVQKSFFQHMLYQVLGLNTWWNYSWGSVTLERSTSVEKLVTLKWWLLIHMLPCLILLNSNFSVGVIGVLLDITDGGSGISLFTYQFLGLSWRSAYCKIHSAWSSHDNYLCLLEKNYLVFWCCASFLSRLNWNYFSICRKSSRKIFVLF